MAPCPCPCPRPGAGSFGLFSCVLDGAERQQSHRAVYRCLHINNNISPHTVEQKQEVVSCGFSRFVPRHEDELYLEIDDPVLIIDQSEDLWCHGYNMRTGSTGIFPAFYTVEVTKEPPPGKKAVKAGSSHRGRPLKSCFSVSAQKEGWTERFLVRFLGSVQVPMHKGNGVLCAAMQKVDTSRVPHSLMRASWTPQPCLIPPVTIPLGSVSSCHVSYSCFHLPHHCFCFGALVFSRFHSLVKFEYVTMEMSC